MRYKQLTEDIYEQGFSIFDNFLPPELCKNLLTNALNLEKNHQLSIAKIGNQKAISTNTMIRNDKIHWLDEKASDQAITAYFTGVRDIAATINQAFYLGLMHFEAHFAFYQPGSFYKKHVDQFQTTQDRKISCVYYLNEDWQASYGGELALYDKTDQLLAAILPTFNRLVCFQSDLPHEVQITQHPRWSIAGWMKSRPCLS